MNRLTAAFALPIALAGAAGAAAPAWQVVPAQSRVAFSGTHAGNPFTGTFQQWTAQIAFDPKDLATSKATVTFATASAKTGDKFQETSLAGEEWFNPAKFPRATFTTTRISAAGPNRYVADGVLQLKDKRVPLKLPFTLAVNGNTATMTAKIALDRAAIDMGMRSDANGAWVSKKIGLDIKLVAQKR